MISVTQINSRRVTCERGLRCSGVNRKPKPLYLFQYPPPRKNIKTGRRAIHVVHVAHNHKNRKLCKYEVITKLTQ